MRPQALREPILAGALKPESARKSGQNISTFRLKVEKTGPAVQYETTCKPPPQR